MTFDLTPLEQAAARAGVPGLRARMIRPDRRRPRWFHWGNSELLVSERVLDRCQPAEASALLIDTILLERQLSRVRRRLAIAVLAGLLVGALAWWSGSWTWQLVPGWVLGACVCFVVLVGRAKLAADDESVKLIGDPVPLVRGFNLMNQDEVRVSSWRSKARPDLHRRAERLARLHRLREAPPPGTASHGVPAGDG